MTSIAAIVNAPLQELRSQALATLFAAMDTIEPIRAIAGGAHGQTLPQGQPVLATVTVPPQNGNITLAVNGALHEFPVSPGLEAEAQANPALFRRGAQFALFADPATRSVRIVLPEATAIPSPATLNSVRTIAPGPSADAAPPLSQVFPNGTPGAALQRLTGLVFPVAEQANATSAAVTVAQNAMGRPLSGASLTMLPSGIAEAALQAAARQGPVSPAISALLNAANTASLTGEAKEALNRLGALRLDGASKPDPGTIERALQQSGLFLEASLAKSQGAGNDVKSLLLALRSAFGNEPSIPRAAPETATPQARGEPAALAKQTTALRQESAQPDIARLIEGAVERIKLNQFASLPEHAALRVTDERAQGFQITTTIPVATQGLERPQTAAIGLMIEHHPVDDAEQAKDDEKGASEEAEGFPWKVRVALDLEETGPVQAEIALRGQSVAITLWAERHTTAALARREIGTLHDALTSAAFDVKRLDVKDGRPIGPAMRNVPVLDRRT